MAYYHVTHARLKFANLLNQHTFSAPSAANWYAGLAVEVDKNGCNWEGNCWWVGGQSPRIVFGANVPYVLDSLVTHHEYAHGFSELIAPYLYPADDEQSVPLGEIEDLRLGKATCEAYADYLACSLKNYPIVLEEWSSSARDLRIPFQFVASSPRDPHEDSKALSSGLWDLRNGVVKPEYNCGAAVVDRWVLETLFRQRNRPPGLPWFGLTEAVSEAIEVDIAAFTGRHVAQMEAVFRARGIFPL